MSLFPATSFLARAAVTRTRRFALSPSTGAIAPRRVRMEVGRVDDLIIRDCSIVRLQVVGRSAVSMAERKTFLRRNGCACDSSSRVACSTLSTSNSGQARGAATWSGQESLPKHDWAACESGQPPEQKSLRLQESRYGDNRLRCYLIPLVQADPLVAGDVKGMTDRLRPLLHHSGQTPQQ